MRTGRWIGLAAAASLAATAAPSFANELAASEDARAFVIHDAAETYAAFCRRDSDGRLWLTLPGGAAYELVTSTSDPAIANPGDGAFHPFDAAEVRAALAEVRFPLAGVHADVFLLPYPRRDGLESAAGPGLVLLAPGVRPIAPEVQHALLAHELGHVVQYAFMPDADVAAWEAYRRLRGIADPTVYSSEASHANRPHEIFAEDFRALFGGATANYSGTIENSEIAAPGDVPGLRDLMLALAGLPLTSVLTVHPNPARGPVEFSRAGGPAVRLDLFDAQGRRVASLDPTLGAGLVHWTWDGRRADGRRVAPGVLYARPRGDGSTAARVTIQP